MEAHTPLLNAHAIYKHIHTDIGKMEARISQLKHTAIYNSSLQIYEKWKRAFHNSMHTHIYKHINTDI